MTLSMIQINTDNIKISVIIPVFNAETTIEDCISALMDQTYSGGGYEIIAVDDGSTDNTEAMLQQYDIHYHHQNNKGPALHAIRV